MEPLEAFQAGRNPTQRISGLMQNHCEDEENKGGGAPPSSQEIEAFTSARDLRFLQHCSWWVLQEDLETSGKAPCLSSPKAYMLLRGCQVNDGFSCSFSFCSVLSLEESLPLVEPKLETWWQNSLENVVSRLPDPTIQGKTGWSGNVAEILTGVTAQRNKSIIKLNGFRSSRGLSHSPFVVFFLLLSSSWKSQVQ